jgi:GNAT superfamily N-acetyltransferase
MRPRGFLPGTTVSGWPAWGNWSTRWIIRRLSLRLPGAAGMLMYVPGQDWQQCEILTLHAGEQWHGAGTALIEAAGHLARRQGCTRLWVITTNDNVDALRFYQRRGFCLVRVHRGAVDRSRSSLKPEIPPMGTYGIPLRDEIELERRP